ncbi:MAG: nucleoside triphosphate pyrophosphohydrolase [Spirochaetaceae bacterium]|jgi:tetrapyrrole methylase family protein/MazG family protein|nr:nucleoside triphosphate pyrophosphohydrolase [Spirochaetaceae bacterium]
MDYGEAFNRLCGIVEKLRNKDEGCPWDIEQTPLTLREDLIEETYECIEAINEKNPAHIQEELGDIFLLAAMISYMHQEEGLFSVPDVLNGISEKLIRRHPHVFGENPAAGLTPAEVLQNWARIKVEQEGRKPKDSALDEVSQALPPLERAYKLQKKAAKKGFDWPNAAGVLDKLKEELAEVEEVMPPDFSAGNRDTNSTEELEEELGDLLFSAVNVSRFFRVDPSTALHRANAKFTRRFSYVEQKMKENGTLMEAKNLALMDSFWNEAKTE